MKWKGKINFDARPQYDGVGLVTNVELDTVSGSLNLAKMDRIVSVDNEIVRFNGIGGDVQGYTSNAPTISDDGNMQIPGGIELDNGFLVGNYHNNLMVNKVTFDILGLMTSPRFLNLMCEDPGAGTMVDVSGNGYDGTYNGAMTSEDRIKKVQGWAIDPDGIDDFIDLGNNSDFSFGDGSNDSAFSLIIATEIDSTETIRTLISKWDETLNSEDREWKITLTADHKAKFEFFDESETVNQNPYAISSVLDVDETHMLGFTYNGVGGANADGGINIYDNGVLDSSITRNGNQTSYTAMEAGSTPTWIGSFTSTSGIASAFMTVNVMMFYIDGVELSGFDMWRVNQLLSGLYSENGEAFVPSEQPAFIFTVQTTGASETFSLPLESSGTYDFNVDWGDSSDDDITVWNQAEVTHTYVSAGTYEIKITGTIIGWRFNNGGDKLKIYEIKSWGPLRLGNNNRYFYGCANLTITATDILDLIGTTEVEYMFGDCSSLTTIPSINSWNFSFVISMFSMFYQATNYNQDMNSCDVSSVKYMNSMLSRTAFDQDIGSWPIISVLMADAMFFETTLSTANYDTLLIGWEAQAVQDNVNFHGGNSKYSAGAAATARQALIDDHNWSITDGGLV